MSIGGNVCSTMSFAAFCRSLESVVSQPVCMSMERYGGLTMVSAAFCRDIESVASELERMSAGSSGRLTVPTADRMRLQLDDMLEQRNAAEALQAEVQRHRRTASLLEEECSKLRIAQSEVGPHVSLPDSSITLCLSAALVCQQVFISLLALSVLSC